MKKQLLAIGLLASIFPAISSAQSSGWFPLSSNMYVLKSEDNEKILLSAGIDTRTGDIAFRILDLTGRVCKDGYVGENNDPLEISVDAQKIQTFSICINGNHLYAPKNPAGQQFLRERIESGQPVLVDSGRGAILVFKGRPPGNLKEKLNSLGKAL